MKVHLIKEKTIRDYVAAQAKSRAPFESWLSKIAGADWELPEDIQETFGSADLLGKSSSRLCLTLAATITE